MVKVNPKMKIGKYFRLIEFVPLDLYKRFGDKILVETYKKLSRDLVSELDNLRKYIGRPIVITSGYRPKSYNKLVGGKNGSQHIYGRAADITVRGLTYIELVEAVLRFNFHGVGIYNNGTVHVDMRPLRKGKPRAMWAGLVVKKSKPPIYKYVSFAEGINMLATSGYLFRKL